MILKSWMIGLYGLVFAQLILATAFADSVDPLGQSRVIGVVPLTKPAAIQTMFRHIDKMVPELKKISSERVIKLECRYNGLPEREQDVSNAYTVAGKVEKYLREHHKLNLDIWVAANIGLQSRQSPPALTFSVFSDAVRNVEKLPVNPAQNPSE
ncbi:MAG TPA: hypothetical protein VGL27_03055 [Negativicutes bacterium]|jgi:hypothetical protein